MNIQLHIERLILEGLPISTEQGPIVQAALESKLVQLLAARGLSPELSQSVAVPSMRLERTPIQTNHNPVQTGHQIAAALMDGLGNNGKSTNINNVKGA